MISPASIIYFDGVVENFGGVEKVVTQCSCGEATSSHIKYEANYCKAWSNDKV